MSKSRSGKKGIPEQARKGGERVYRQAQRERAAPTRRRSRVPVAAQKRATRRGAS